MSVADPGFPRGGGANSPGGAPTYDFAKFSQKLHEIERIWIPRGARPKFYYVDPPLHVPSFFLIIFSTSCLMYRFTDDKGFSSLSWYFRCVAPKRENHMNFVTVLQCNSWLFRLNVTRTTTQQLWRISLSLSPNIWQEKLLLARKMHFFGIEINFLYSSESKSAILCYFSHRIILNN